MALVTFSVVTTVDQEIFARDYFVSQNIQWVIFFVDNLNHEIFYNEYFATAYN